MDAYDKMYDVIYDASTPIFASLRCGAGTVIPARGATSRDVMYTCPVCNQYFRKRISDTRGYGASYIEVVCKYFKKGKRQP